MSFPQEPKTATSTARPVTEIKETTGGGPLVTNTAASAQNYVKRVRRLSAQGRMEKIGFWILVVAALAVILFLLGFFLPKIAGALLTGVFIGAFAGLLTIMNLSQPSVWGNAVLGRKVFPVLRAPDDAIWRLAVANAGFMFAFAALFAFVSSFFGLFFGGLIVFGGLVALAVFFSRVRSVIIKP